MTQVSLEIIEADGTKVAVSSNNPLPVTGTITSASEVMGAVDDGLYSDPTGVDDGTMISLLKGIYEQLTIIATNTGTP